MNESSKKRLIGIVVVGVIAIVTLFLAIRIPSIATWQASSFEIDHLLSRKASIESQIRAIERRDPHKEFQKHAMDQNLFFYAIADTQVIIPGVDKLTLPFQFPIHVISGTGEQGAGARNEYLNRIARAFAEIHNKEMHGYIVTW